MYALDEVARDGEAFRAAVAQARAYKPLYVKLKLLWGCNLRCAMCNHWRSSRPRQLSTAQICALFDELAALGCRKVHLTGGEPGLRPDLEQLVGHAARAGIRPVMTSNATLITRARARRLLEAGLRGLNVSIDSPDPDTHDKVRGVPGCFEQSMQGLKNLRKEAHRGKLGLALNTVITRFNFRTLSELPKLALRVGARALRLLPVDDHTGQALRLDEAEVQEWNSELAPLLARRGLRAGLFKTEAEAYPFGSAPGDAPLAARGEYALGYYRERPCLAPFTHALVDHEGDVHACCMARGEPLLGNLHGRRFETVWNGEPFRRLRLGMARGERLSPCERCDDFVGENRRLQQVLES